MKGQTESGGAKTDKKARREREGRCLLSSTGEEECSHGDMDRQRAKERKQYKERRVMSVE
jgi:hypothetical protein